MSVLLLAAALHLAVCLLLLLLRIIGVAKYEYIGLLIALLLPVWGVLILFLKAYSDRHRNRAAAALELKQMHAEETMQSIQTEEQGSEAVPLNEALIVNDNATRRQMMRDILYEVNRNIVEDPDDSSDMTVPLEEAMIVNDSATRRTLLIEALYSNPADYVPQLFDAKSNEDTEVVHYAATALTEIQKHYDLQFQALARRRSANPEDGKLDDEYQTLLEKYIASGLLKGDGLRTQLRAYSDLLGKKLRQPEVRGRWSLLNKKAGADLRLGDADALDWDVAQMAEEWADRENYWIFRIESAILRRDAETIQKLLTELKQKNIYMSQKLRSVIDFWGGQSEGTEHLA